MDWDPKYALGVERIDAQHQALFQQLGQLRSALGSRDLTVVGQALEFLGRYLLEHFHAEEREMALAAYPLLGEHNLAHRRFAQEYLKLQTDYQSGSATPELAERIHAFVRDWLTSHILGMDQEFGKYLKRRAQPRPGEPALPHR